MNVFMFGSGTQTKHRRQQWTSRVCVAGFKLVLSLVCELNPLIATSGGWFANLSVLFIDSVSQKDKDVTG